MGDLSMYLGFLILGLTIVGNFSKKNPANNSAQLFFKTAFKGRRRDKRIVVFSLLLLTLYKSYKKLLAFFTLYIMVALLYFDTMPKC